MLFLHSPAQLGRDHSHIQPRRITLRRFSLFLSFLLLVIANSAFAQSDRTWVSGVGDDVNPCSRTAPCKTFAGAISKTSNGGEIDVLDPGGFGALTIVKPITIDGGGSLAGVLVTGTGAFIINTTGPNDTVILRNLDINGVRASGNAGTNGIRILAAHNVHIENCTIHGFSGRGISVENSADVRLFVRDTIIRNNGEGIGSFSTGGNVFMTLKQVHADQNDGQGLDFSYATTASVVDSTLNGNGASGLIAWGSTVSVAFDRSELDNNAYGIYAGYVGGMPTIRLSHSLITGNTTSGLFLNGGTVTGFNNNVITGNAGNNLVSMSVAQQ
jgi:hypothetical protein